MPNAANPSAEATVSNCTVNPSRQDLEYTFSAALHHLIITGHVGGNEDDLSSPLNPRLPDQFHCVWPAPSLLRVPENHPIWLDVLIDEGRDRRPERLLLVGSNPDEEPGMMSDKALARILTGRNGDSPVLALDAGRQRRTDACARADADASVKHGRCMTNTGYFRQSVGRPKGIHACVCFCWECTSVLCCGGFPVGGPAGGGTYRT